MIVVSDTSPLNYLILIESIHILPALFQKVYVPERVAAELINVAAPRLVQAWAASPPSWLVVRAPVKIDRTLRLDPGETDAISLAQELSADHLLVDEWAGRMAARDRGIHVVGTLGVLVQASEQKLLNLKDAFNKLSRTTFRADRRLLDQLLTDFGERNE